MPGAVVVTMGGVEMLSGFVMLRAVAGRLGRIEALVAGVEAVLIERVALYPPAGTA